MMQGRVLDDAGPSGSMQGRLEEPDRHQPGHGAQGQLPARPPRSVGLSGRLAKEPQLHVMSPMLPLFLTLLETFPRTSPQEDKLLLYGHISSWTWREASDTRAESVTLQEKTPGTQQVGHRETLSRKNVLLASHKRKTSREHE